jgi:hypothetical protein
MPRTKQQLRRFSAIVQVLNNNRHRLIKIKTIQTDVCILTDQHVSLSTIEKDLSYLMTEYDLDEITERKYGILGGYRFTEKVDFLQLLKKHLNLF